MTYSEDRADDDSAPEDVVPRHRANRLIRGFTSFLYRKGLAPEHYQTHAHHQTVESRDRLASRNK